MKANKEETEMFQQFIYRFAAPLLIFNTSKTRLFSLIFSIFSNIYRQGLFHRVFIHQTLCTWVLGLVLVLGVGNSAVAVDFDPIVYSGQQAVGAPPGFTHGEGFLSPSNPALGGDIDSSVYYTGLVRGSSGLWRGNRESTVAFFIQGDPAPGTEEGVTFESASRLISPNDVGQTAFIGIVRDPDGPSSFPDGIWAGAPGALGLVALQGGPAPGTNSTFRGAFTHLAYNNAGQVAFRDFFESGSGIWSGTPGSIEAVALTGDPAPGFGAGATISGLGGEF